MLVEASRAHLRVARKTLALGFELVRQQLRNVQVCGKIRHFTIAAGRSLADKHHEACRVLAADVDGAADGGGGRNCVAVQVDVEVIGFARCRSLLQHCQGTRVSIRQFGRLKRCRVMHNRIAQCRQRTGQRLAHRNDVVAFVLRAPLFRLLVAFVGLPVRLPSMRVVDENRAVVLLRCRADDRHLKRGRQRGSRRGIFRRRGGFGDIRHPVGKVKRRFARGTPEQQRRAHKSRHHPPKRLHVLHRLSSIGGLYAAQMPIMPVSAGSATALPSPDSFAARC